VQLPSSLRSIGEHSFSETNISTITIPEGVTSIGNSCFKKCRSLTSIELPSSLINIGDEAFCNTHISTITIPEGVTSIGDYCFTYCESLTSIQLPSSLLSIGRYAFCHEYDWESKVPLKQVEVPKNCKIGNKAFEEDCKVIRK
ncbi:MAG: leucine-rich repeat domain-containing protein, partial [Clostridiales bacterium]|uniref:leucine-rich repeat domain-containing protein n=1 Tax=Terrisporobacter sp. TaxID=1965305 RepID=UPI002A572171